MTPAVNELRQAGIEHQVVEYHHDPHADSYGLEAAETLGLDPATVFKTLLADLSDSRTVVALVPVTGRLDLKALARAAGAKKASMTDPATAEKVTGYVVGGISAFGQRRRLATYLDASALDHREIHVSGGRRGLEITLDPHDLVHVLAAEVATLASPAR